MERLIQNLDSQLAAVMMMLADTRSLLSTGAMTDSLSVTMLSAVTG